MTCIKYIEDTCPCCEELYKHCQCETEESVAEGLGFIVDDEGRWIYDNSKSH